MMHVAVTPHNVQGSIWATVKGSIWLETKIPLQQLVKEHTIEHNSRSNTNMQRLAPYNLRLCGKEIYLFYIIGFWIIAKFYFFSNATHEFQG